MEPWVQTLNSEYNNFTIEKQVYTDSEIWIWYFHNHEPEIENKCKLWILNPEYKCYNQVTIMELSTNSELWIKQFSNQVLAIENEYTLRNLNIIIS